MLHGQQIDIAVPGDIKNMSALTNELFFTACKPLTVDRACQITRLYNIHISSSEWGGVTLSRLAHALAMPVYAVDHRQISPDTAYPLISFPVLAEAK